MENTISGIHHITAIAGNAKRNYEFYTRILGLRMVKKTVNFDDPGTYHFYFGDETGTPGTILTFFPWEHVKKGIHGAGMATEIGYSVPQGSLSFWTDRFKKFNVKVTGTGTRFGEQYLSFEDPDGLVLTLVIPNQKDERKPWETDDIDPSAGIRGFHYISLTLKSIKETAAILTDVFGYKFSGQEGHRYRYTTNAVDNAAIVDLIEAQGQPMGVNAGGTIHHIAFRVKDEKVLMAFRDKIIQRGMSITPKIDRNYFFSIYFREPGGVLFELATDNPGFAVDEKVSELGMNLKLPAQYESHRAAIEKVLPALT